MFKAKTPIIKKDYISANLYYLRKFVGIREIVLAVFLLAAGLTLYFWVGNLFILIMCGITVVLMAGALLFYWGTAVAGYKMEFEKRDAVRWEFFFEKEEFTADVFEQGGEEKFSDKITYDSLDKVAIKKDRVYIYASAAIVFYIRHQDFTQGNFIEFCDFIKAAVTPDKLKMKTKRRRQFPYTR
ncbi:MAG: hypothetical protein WC292_01515 [Clostridia bacterium]